MKKTYGLYLNFMIVITILSLSGTGDQITVKQINPLETGAIAKAQYPEHISDEEIQDFHTERKKRGKITVYGKFYPQEHRVNWPTQNVRSYVFWGLSPVLIIEN